MRSWYSKNFLVKNIQISIWIIKKKIETTGSLVNKKRRSNTIVDELAEMEVVEILLWSQTVLVSSYSILRTLLLLLFLQFLTN